MTSSIVWQHSFHPR